ncbi:hypothetical protein CrV_gp030 [Cylindrospermopsis raciborskii virus RM-2018a]|nr:hypothetical protein CrV_gp030 [Cylindrospermopsis raciborskii virus RM-2018a]WHL30596.1 hypothetical protein CrLKS4_g30 [Cylindrospermopsis phage Cr-LKS4]
MDWLNPQPLNGCCLEVKLLPVNEVTGETSSDIPKFEVLCNATSTIGYNYLTLSSFFDVELKAGTCLSFGDPNFGYVPGYRKQAILVNDTTIDNIQTQVEVYPLLHIINEGDLAEVVEGVIPLNGVQAIDLSSQEVQVETTDFRTRRGVKNTFIRQTKSCTVSGIALTGDKALETIIKPVGIFSNLLYGRDIYAAVTMPDGERFAGIAKISNLALPANQNEVKRFSFNLLYQGDYFEWYPPFCFDDFS